MAGMHVVGKFLGGKIFLEILNDAVQHLYHEVNWKNVLPNFWKLFPN